MDKSFLRKTALEYRSQLLNDIKTDKDSKITNALFCLDCYKNAKNVFCYVSMNNEINTLNILSKCIEDKKIVAVPKCADKNGNMDFFVIHSLNDLADGFFGVQEPKDYCKKAVCNEKTIIIIPGLCFSNKGYRVGYGKGYYDRWLQNNDLLKIGLCYSKMIFNNNFQNKYDIPVDIIITESNIISISFDGGQNGR